MQRFRVNIKGHVQGVGCRYFILQIAIKYTLVGFVLNKADGSVEFEIQGEVSKLQYFMQEMLHGNRFIKIEEHVLEEIELKQNESKFKMIY